MYAVPYCCLYSSRCRILTVGFEWFYNLYIYGKTVFRFVSRINWPVFFRICLFSPSSCNLYNNEHASTISNIAPDFAARGPTLINKKMIMYLSQNGCSACFFCIFCIICWRAITLKFKINKYIENFSTNQSADYLKKCFAASFLKNVPLVIIPHLFTFFS